MQPPTTCHPPQNPLSTPPATTPLINPTWEALLVAEACALPGEDEEEFVGVGVHVRGGAVAALEDLDARQEGDLGQGERRGSRDLRWASVVPTAHQQQQLQ